MRKILIAVIGVFTISGASPLAAQEYFYGTGDAGTSIFRTDVATGASTRIGSSGFSATWAGAYNPDGIFYTLINSNRLGSLSLTTGAATSVGTATSPEIVYGLEIAADGRIFAAAAGNGGLYGVDASTGVFSRIGSLGIGGIMDLAFDATGNLFAVAMNRLYTLNLATGAATLVRTLTGLSGEAMGMSFGADGRLFVTTYEANSGLFSVDMATGSTTLVGRTGIYFAHGGDILMPPTEVVPEPVSLILTATGLMGLYAVRRRRRNAANNA